MQKNPILLEKVNGKWELYTHRIRFVDRAMTKKYILQTLLGMKIFQLYMKALNLQRLCLCNIRKNS